MAKARRTIPVENAPRMESYQSKKTICTAKRRPDTLAMPAIVQVDSEALCAVRVNSRRWAAPAVIAV